MRFKEVKRLIKESQLQEQDLFEINMSPSNLEKLASQIDAMAGMEFEMIVPDATSGDDEGELEPNYDEDRRVRSLSDVEDFFYDGDFNGRREVQRLLEQLEDEYGEWLYDKMSEAWAEQGLERVVEYVRENLNSIDGIDDFRLQAEDEVKEANPDLPEGSDDYQQLVGERFSELVDTWAEEQYQNDDNLAQQVREEFEEEYRGDNDIDEWVSRNYPRMTDIDSTFDITWPYWESPGGEGEANVEDVADEFSRAVGVEVNWSSNYHGAKRESNKYVVEPDGSLDPDDSNDAGLEFVSPPLKLEQMLTDLDKVKAWADKRGCYTNKSTGLHINVSVPGLTTEKLDYVKLALLLGDKYVLDQFGRAGNTYAKSAMDMVKERVRQRPEDATALLEKMKQGLNNLATKVIHSGETSKYTSINTKGGYVEFRSPGGDWLSDDFFKKIKPTLLRFIVALDAAMDPEKYREEYLKKLYQLLQPKSQTDTLSYFAKYAAGELPKSALKSFVRQAQLERKVNKEPTGIGKKYWWEVRFDNGARMEVVAGSKEVARDVAAEEWRIDPNRIGLQNIHVIRPYEPEPTQTQPAPASISGTTQDLQQQRAQGGFTGAWKIVADDGREIYRFSGVGNSQADANRVAAQWLQNNRGRTGPQTGFTVVPIMGS